MTTYRTSPDVYGDYIEVTSVKRGGETFVDVASHSPGGDTYRSAGVDSEDRVDLALAVLAGTDCVVVERADLRRATESADLSGTPLSRAAARRLDVALGLSASSATGGAR